MKRIFFLIIFAASSLFIAGAQDLTKVVFTPNWTPQSQFSGFYIAKELGFYEEEGLDVTINHIGSNSSESVSDKLKTGEAQFVEQQLMQAIIARSDGAKIVNVMQLTQHTGMMIVANRPISTINDLDGMKIGRWRQGYSEMCELLTLMSNIQVDWIPTLGGINTLLFGAIDATLCYSYSEYVKLYLATGDIPDENALTFAEMGVDGPEDGIYVMEKYYKKHPDVVEKFVRATKRGWEYAREHKDEAVDIAIRYCDEANVQTNRVFQEMMLDEYLRLQVNDATGKADFARVEPENFNPLADILSYHNIIINKPTYEELIK